MSTTFVTLHQMSRFLLPITLIAIGHRSIAQSEALPMSVVATP